MHYFYLSLLGALFISALSICGAVFISLKKEKLEKILIPLVSFAAGALLSNAFFHILPEAIGQWGSPEKVFQIVVFGTVFFFLLEKAMRIHHCHKIGCENRRHLGYLNLLSDGMHNFIDGVIIVSSFSIDIKLGMAVLVSIALHEIPQEIGDFGVLVYSGFSKIKALAFNFLSAILAVLGVIAGAFFLEHVNGFNNYLLPLAASSFIYIAFSDLIPEIHKETNFKKSFVSFLFFTAAILLAMFFSE